MQPPETGPVSDAALVVAARDGDRTAFSDLMSRHSTPLNACLLAFVPGTEVDDLMQETMLAAWRGLPTLRDVARPLPWLFGIARNLGRREYARRQRRPRSLQQAESLVSPGSAADGDTLAPERLLEFLQELPEAYRVSLAMRLIEGIGSEGIATATGLTPASVRVNLSRGMKLLRERLQREGYP